MKAKGPQPMTIELQQIFYQPIYVFMIIGLKLRLSIKKEDCDESILLHVFHFQFNTYGANLTEIGKQINGFAKMLS